MVQTFDISNWIEQPWWNTGGTRNKKVYQSPEGDIYYFKQSLKKLKKDYKYEFWSEIIASEIGILCDLNVLQYHLAIRGNEIGCLSKSMIKENEELIEGGKFLQAFDSTFNPTDKKARFKYNFTIIEEAIKLFELKDSFKDVLRVLVFDALIGNSDRHQENWAFIATHSNLSRSLAIIEYVVEHDKLKELPNKFYRKLTELIYTVKGRMRPSLKRARLTFSEKLRFAPIYDNGCSFGRELEDERVIEFLKDSKLIDSYVKKGTSEIHWGSKKIDHFSLLENLLMTEDFKEEVSEVIQQVIDKFDIEKVVKIIKEVDSGLPENLMELKIPDERKQLISKLVASRYDMLKTLIKNVK